MVKAADSFVLAGVEQGMCRAGRCEMNRNEIRGTTWSWVLTTLSCWVPTVCICTSFLTFTFSLFIQNGQEMQTWDLCSKLSVDPIYSSEFILIFTFVWGQHGNESLINTASITKPAGSRPGRSKSEFEVRTCNMHLYALQSWWHWVYLLWMDWWSANL